MINQLTNQSTNQLPAQDSFNKVRAQGLREAYRAATIENLHDSPRIARDIDYVKARLPKDMMTSDDEVRVPFSKDGLKVALLNAERYADRNVQRQLKAGGVKVPEQWEAAIERPREPEPQQQQQGDAGAEVDYAALIRQIDGMDPAAFKDLDLDQLIKQYDRVPARSS